MTAGSIEFIKKFMKKSIILLDWLVFLCLAPFLLFLFFVIVLFSEKAPPFIKDSPDKRILRFVTSNLEAVMKWKCEPLLMTNLDGFFQKSVIVFLPNVFENDGFYQKEGIDFYQYSQHPDTLLKKAGFRKTNAVIRWLTTLITLYRLVNREKISVLFAQDPHYLGGNALLLSRLTGVPYIIHLVTNYDIKDRMARGLAFPPFLFLFVELFIEKVIYRHALFISSSYGNYKEYAIQHGADPKKTYSFNATFNNIHLKKPEERKNVRSELSLSEETKLLLYVGRLAAVKSPLDLIDCLEIIRQKRKDVFQLSKGDA